MKAIILATTLLLAAATSFANTDINDEARLKPVHVNSAFIPSSFSSDADAYVIVSGIFPNGCYSWGRADVQHDGFTHEITTLARVTDGPCLKMLIPFTEKVNLGQLEIGDHTVRFVNGDGTFMDKPVTIEE